MPIRRTGSGRPDKDDVCDHGLDATSIRAGGQTHVERFHAATNPR